MRAFLLDGSVYIDPDKSIGEAFFVDREGRIGVEADDGEAIRWFVYRDGFAEVEKTAPTSEQAALLELVSFGVAGEPGRS
jgi:hypothetical protein